MKPRLPAEFFRIAAQAPCDIKTARAYFDPEKRKRMKPSVSARVSVAVLALGFEDPAQEEPHQAA